MTTRQQINDFKQNANMRLAGKIALITGASRGIGEATARLFAQEGATIVLAARSDEEMARIVEEIKANRGEAMRSRRMWLTRLRLKPSSSVLLTPTEGSISRSTTLGLLEATSP